MVGSERFSINSSKITHETIDGEVVIVNLASGSYYSLDGAGAQIWGCIERRASLSEIIAYIGERFDGKDDEFARAVKQLTDELKNEGLILQEPGNGQAATAGAAPVPQAPQSQATKGQFNPPSLHKYTDMQDLLLLDPIHDVDEAGWPTVKPDATNEDNKA